MPKQIFINLVVSDLEKSMNLYTQMGFRNNPKFSDETAKCMVWSDDIFLMIMVADRFKTFASKPLADTKNTLAGLFALSMENVEQMHELVNNALAAGATEPTEMKDYGFMVQRNVEDFDGHTWEIFFMDESKMPSS